MRRRSLLLLSRCKGTAIAFTLLLLASDAITQAPVTPGAIAAELRQHQPQAAMRDAEAALKADAGDPRLWTLKALAARELNDPRTALSAFEAALRIAPDYLPALEGAAELAYGGEPETCAVYVDRILRQAPNDPTANGMAGMLAYRRGEWAEAAAHFSKGGEQVFAQRVTLEAYADALGRLDLGAEAEPLFRKIVEGWPDDEQARYNLAVLELRAGHAADAAQTLQPLVETQSGTRDPQALSLAAAACEAAGDTPRAVALLREAIQQSPKDARNYLDFAAISFDHSSFAAGITMLNAGLTQLPRSAPLWVARGVLYMQSAQVERAESDFETANRLDPSQSFGLEAQGLTDMQRHDLPGALTKVRASLQADPKSAYLNYLAAEILKEQGAAPHSPEARSAITYAEQALEYDPKLIAARNLLGSLAQQAGDYPLAEQQCRAALEQDSSDQEAVFRLILILRRSGDKQHEIPALVAELGKLRTEEHRNQVKADRYRLEIPAGPVSR